MAQDITLDDIFDIYNYFDHSVETVELAQNITSEDIVNILLNEYPPPPPPEIIDDDDLLDQLIDSIAKIDFLLILKLIKVGLVSQNSVYGIIGEHGDRGDDRNRYRIPIIIALVVSGRNYNIPLDLFTVSELVAAKRAGYDVPTHVICDELVNTAINHFYSYNAFMIALDRLTEAEIDLSDCINELQLPLWFYVRRHRDYDHRTVSSIWNSIVKSDNIHEVRTFVKLAELGLNARHQPDEWKRQFVHNLLENGVGENRVHPHQDWDDGIGALIDVGIIPKRSDLTEPFVRGFRPGIRQAFEKVLDEIDGSLFNASLAQIIDSNIDISSLPSVLQKFQK